MTVVCLNCRAPYPESGVPYRCPRCGGTFDEQDPFQYLGSEAAAPGIWRYLGPTSRRIRWISLGEGDTPLLPADIAGRRVYFKCEYTNPTGSFKDRGSAVLVSFLLSRGIQVAIEDSSGNAGASFAAYAARAGIKARIYAPASASGLKRQQIEMYGADLIPVPGPRSAASQTAEREAEAGIVYASHAHLPQNLEGYATCAYEIVDQLGQAPGAIIVPAGQGGLLLGLGRGFATMQGAGRVSEIPMLIGVQAAACAPLAALFEVGLQGLDLVTEGPTIAEGVRVRTPLRAEAVLRLTRLSGGRITVVAEERILPGRDALAQLGFYVEPTSAVVWDALLETLPDLRDPVVVILTGSGYKTIN